MLAFAIILLIINLIVFSIVYIQMRRRFSADQYQKNIRDEVYGLIVDIRRQTDVSISLMEDKIEALQDLINRADKRIALGTKELVAKQTEKVLMSNLAPKSEPVQIYTRKRVYRSEKQIEARATPQEQVLELFRQGFSLEMIDKQVDLPLGEIELIIGMHGGE